MQIGAARELLGISQKELASAASVALGTGKRIEGAREELAGTVQTMGAHSARTGAAGIAFIADARSHEPNGTWEVEHRGARFCRPDGYLIIALCSLVPGEYRPHIDGWSGKEEHALAYLALDLTVITARQTVNVYRLCIIIVAYAGILEFLQLFASGRHAAVGDFMASSLGGIMGITLTTFAVSRLARI